MSVKPGAFTAQRPTVLVAAGLEPSARAGLLVDVETLRVAGVRFAGVATALTAQGEKVFRVEPVRAETVAAQVRVSVEDGVHAVKIGLVPNARVLNALSSTLPRNVPWVVDPVIRSSTGGQLSSLSPRYYLSFADAHVILTPNSLEAGWLLGRLAPSTEAEAAAAARDLLAKGFGAVLLKGGHLEGRPSDFVAVAGETKVWVLRGRRLTRTPAQRGTGCRFSSAVAAQLALGADLLSATRRAKDVVTRFIAILGRNSRSADPGV
ncbi:MAG: bifunctional hydroxymethylpyrimidine kinase/phosphomethylpyrimidine kinase [Myxococcaceae bacterium]